MKVIIDNLTHQQRAVFEYLNERPAVFTPDVTAAQDLKKERGLAFPTTLQILKDFLAAGLVEVQHPASPAKPEYKIK